MLPPVLVLLLLPVLLVVLLVIRIISACSALIASSSAWIWRNLSWQSSSHSRCAILNLSVSWIRDLWRNLLWSFFCWSSVDLSLPEAVLPGLLLVLLVLLPLPRGSGLLPVGVVLPLRVSAPVPVPSPPRSSADRRWNKLVTKDTGIPQKQIWK